MSDAELYARILARWHGLVEYWPRRLRRASTLVYIHPEHGSFYRALLSCDHMVTVPLDYLRGPDGKPRPLVPCSKCYPIEGPCDFCGQQHPKAESCQSPCVEVHGTR